MVLLKADMKANFLYFSMCMSVNKLVCKCHIKFRGKNRKKFKNCQKSFGWYGNKSSPDVRELKIPSHLSNLTKRASKKKKNKDLVVVV